MNIAAIKAEIAPSATVIYINTNALVQSKLCLFSNNDLTTGLQCHILANRYSATVEF